MSEKSMTLYSSTFGEKNYPTFKMMPCNENCPHLEAIFSREDRPYLVVIGKFKRNSFRMLDKMDKDGNPVLISDVKENVPKFGSTTKAVEAAVAFGLHPYVRERVQVETLPEYYISDPKEIKAFVEKFAENAKTFDYQSYLDAPPIVTEPEQTATAETHADQLVKSGLTVVSQEEEK